MPKENQILPGTVCGMSVMGQKILAVVFNRGAWLGMTDGSVPYVESFKIKPHLVGLYVLGNGLVLKDDKPPHHFVWSDGVYRKHEFAELLHGPDEILKFLEQMNYVEDISRGSHEMKAVLGDLMVLHAYLNGETLSETNPPAVNKLLEIFFDGIPLAKFPKVMSGASETSFTHTDQVLGEAAIIGGHVDLNEVNIDPAVGPSDTKIVLDHVLDCASNGIPEHQATEKNVFQKTAGHSRYGDVIASCADEGG